MTSFREKFRWGKNDSYQHYSPPYPELIRHRTFDVAHTENTCILVGPTYTGGDLQISWEPEDRSVRRHLFGHVAWSPDKIETEKYALLVRAIEDARIHGGLAALDLPVTCDKLTCQMCDMARAIVANSFTEPVEILDPENKPQVVGYTNSLSPNDLYLIAALEIAVMFTDYETSSGHPTVKKAVDLVRSKLKFSKKGPMSRYRVVLDLTEEISAIIGLPTQPMLGFHIHPTFQNTSRENSEYRRLLQLMHAYSIEMPPTKSGKEQHWSPPGDMYIEKPRLSRKIPTRASGRIIEKLPNEEGCVPMRMNRYAIDQRIFFRKRKYPAPCATVLVDCSGSMHFSAEDVERIIRESGSLATVAIYSGQGAAGVLKIVAKEGHIAEADDCFVTGRSNVIDLPALHWLQRQAAPRIWLSDGAVTGIGDIPSHQMNTLCSEAVKEGKISRVEDLQGVLNELS